MSKRIGVAALARPTFDVPFAEELARDAFETLDALDVELVGSRKLLFDTVEATAALKDLAAQKLDALLLLQVTFTDASMAVEFARTVSAPLAIWAFPETRSGGRLRLNSFCGLNLALHALGRAGKAASYLYSSPKAPHIGHALTALLTGATLMPPPTGPSGMPAVTDQTLAQVTLENLKGRKIGLVGEHPVGFDTCRYDSSAIKALMGMDVEPITLGELFKRAKTAPIATVEKLRRDVGVSLKGIDEVDQVQLDRSLSVFDALRSLAQDKQCSAMAVRCWPEMFTEYGCAACGPMAMLNGAQIPAACEADVYGAMTSLLLQEIAGESSWLADIVDIDAASDTGVLWHCGLAPLSMCDPLFRPEAQIHTNRRMPLLHQFPLKPGRITLARISQARNRTTMIVGGGEVARAPMSFTGTSATVKFDGGTEKAMQRLLGHALEHHLAIVYGDHRGALRAVGSQLGLPVVELC
jgi:L-fucose isomerase-like protein